MSRALVPYDRHEAMSLSSAATLSGRSQTTVRKWCEVYEIGRRIVGGPWEVSRPALLMLLDGDGRALASYLDGDRSSDLVASYFLRAGATSTYSSERT